MNRIYSFAPSPLPLFEVSSNTASSVISSSSHQNQPNALEESSEESPFSELEEIDLTPASSPSLGTSEFATIFTLSSALLPPQDITEKDPLDKTHQLAIEQFSEQASSSLSFTMQEPSGLSIQNQSIHTSSKNIPPLPNSLSPKTQKRKYILIDTTEELVNKTEKSRTKKKELDKARRRNKRIKDKQMRTDYQQLMENEMDFFEKVKDCHRLIEFQQKKHGILPNFKIDHMAENPSSKPLDYKKNFLKLAVCLVVECVSLKKTIKLLEEERSLAARVNELNKN